MHTDRVDVLDRTHHDRVVGGVAHQLEFVLFPPEDRLLEQHLGRRRLVQAVTDHPHEFVPVVREARAEPAHRERRPHHQRVTEVFGGIHRFPDRVHDVTAGDIGTGFENEILEELAVFALLDGFDLRADQLDAVLLQNPGFVEGDRRVEGGLSAQSRQDRIRLLVLDDRLERLVRDRLDVGGIREVGVGHDRRRVRVHENDPDAFGPQHSAGLRSRVVELGGLADHDRARPDDQNRMDVVALRHYLASRRSSTMSRNRSNR